MDFAGFAKVASYLGEPLVLVGFVLVLFFGIHRLLIEKGIIRPPSNPTPIVKMLLTYGFVVALVVIILGFGLVGLRLLVT